LGFNIYFENKTWKVMMIANLQSPILSPAEYLAWEADQNTKHEYENGKIIAMTVGTIPHSQISANLAALLKSLSAMPKSPPHQANTTIPISLSPVMIAIALRVTFCNTPRSLSKCCHPPPKPAIAVSNSKTIC